MATLRTVKFPWVKGRLVESEAEVVYFGEANPTVLLPVNSTEVLIRLVDGESRIWATLGLDLDALDRLIGNLQAARDNAEAFCEQAAKDLLDKYNASSDHAA